jgi:rubrerythrin
MLAHQGEELLIPALIVALVLVGPMIRQRFRRPGEPPDGHEPGACAYCGAVVTDQDERCPACGFRVSR